MIEQGTAFTLNEVGAKLLGEDEVTVKPRLTSAPPATRLSQLSTAVPKKLPEAKLVSCRVRAAGGEGVAVTNWCVGTST